MPIVAQLECDGSPNAGDKGSGYDAALYGTAMLGVARPSLWRHGDFRRLWAAATVSVLGSQVTLIAVPYIALTMLQATVFEVSLLAAIEMLPFLLFTLPAGAWLDRVRRPRPKFGQCRAGAFLRPHPAPVSSTARAGLRPPPERVREWRTLSCLRFAV